MLKAPSGHDERAFERHHISQQRDRYLSTDVLERVTSDAGYADKVSLIEDFLRAHHAGGYVLDVGANTCGEAEILVTRGYDIVATDINEVALALSRRRANSFRAIVPQYYACDVHSLPFAPSTFGSIVAFEVLHHFEQMAPALGELFRVLRPGGHLFALEPYAWNPYRRIAELRFYAKGSIERSFTKRGLERLLLQAGFDIVVQDRSVLPPSSWKKKYVSAFRGLLRNFYYLAKRTAPWLFGDLVVVARKPGVASKQSNGPLEKRLICPVTHTPLRRIDNGFICSGRPRLFYPMHDGVPVLVKEDAKPFDEIEQR